jgi:iron complex transport system substrate-binding protein
MSARREALQAGALVAALGLSTAGALLVGLPADGPPPQAAVPERVAPGAGTVVDARGVEIPTGEPARIVSLNPVADLLLLELVAPERLVAATRYTRDQHPWGWRLGERPGVASSDALEDLLILEPDLIIASAYADAAALERLREAGVVVFDLGQMRGVETTLAGIEALGALLRVPGRARSLAHRYRSQVAALEDAVPPDEHVDGMYLSLTGGALYGGTAGSSYADLLRLGGIRDLAARAGHQGWPRYTVEEVLALDPPVVLTPRGGREALCGHDLLHAIAACRPGGRILELDPALAADPGLGLPEAARRVQEALHRR